MSVKDPIAEVLDQKVDLVLCYHCNWRVRTAFGADLIGLFLFYKALKGGFTNTFTKSPSIQELIYVVIQQLYLSSATK